MTVSSSSSESFSSGYVTKEELDEIARLKGLQLSTETVGPFFKITARRKIEDKRIEVVNADGEVLEKESEDMSVVFRNRLSDSALLFSKPAHIQKLSGGRTSLSLLDSGFEVS